MRSSSEVTSSPLAGVRRRSAGGSCPEVGARSFGVLTEMAKLFGEAPVSAERARLDGADRQPETLGNLGLRQLVEVLQAHHLAFVGGEVVDCLAYGPDVVRPLDSLGEVDDCRHIASRLLQPLRTPPRFAPVEIDRCPPRDRGQPRSEVAA